MVPVETSILALDGLKILLTTLDDVREGFGHNIVLAGVLACRYDSRTRLSRMVLEELAGPCPGKVFQTVIRENVRMRECPATGMSILDYACDSHAAEDYRSLAREVIALDEARQAAFEAGTVTAAAPRDLNADYWKQIAPCSAGRQRRPRPTRKTTPPTRRKGRRWRRQWPTSRSRPWRPKRPSASGSRDCDTRSGGSSSAAGSPGTDERRRTRGPTASGLAPPRHSSRVPPCTRRWMKSSSVFARRS